MFEKLKKILRNHEKFENIEDLITVDGIEDIMAYMTGIPIKKDKTPITIKSTQTYENLNKNKLDGYSNRRNCGYSVYVENQNNPCDFEENLVNTDRRLTCDKFDKEKWSDINRVSDPFIQTSTYERYNYGNYENPLS